ncbi:MAG: hypothetical protein JWL71_5030 [Acidobacteria bacterium]|nr:hypothetical protein [Acidobacteriota bacterium]
MACVPAGSRGDGAPARAQRAELSVDPGSTPRHRFAGKPAGGHVRPATESRIYVVKRDTGGLRITSRVRDDNGHEWSGAMLGAARFRPIDSGLKPRGERSWRESPCVGTREDGGVATRVSRRNNSNEITARYVARIRENMAQDLELR